ncbi:MAG TPA: hypothetical protein VGB54_01805, partial [Allosphingosinicella sp.]
MKARTVLLAVLLALGAPAALPAQQAAPAPPGAEAGPLPVRRYAALPSLRGATLSPDGTRIAAQFTAGGVERIGIWTLARGPGAEPEQIQAGLVESFQWAGDDRLLITTLTLTILARRNTIYLGPSRQVISLDLRTKHPIELGSSQGVFEEVIFVDPEAR